MRKKNTDDIEKGDIVEVSPVAESQEAFKGKAVRIQEYETVLRPVESTGGVSVLGININHRKDRFMVLVGEGKRKRSEAYLIKSIEVYDPNVNSAEDLNAEEILEVKNVVGGGEISLTDLDEVRSRITDRRPEEEVWFDDQDGGLNFEPDDGPVITIHESGSYLIRSDSKVQMLLADKLLLDILGEDIVESEIEVANLVGKFELGFSIDLRIVNDNIEEDVDVTVDYNECVFPGLRYSNDNFSSNFLLYPNGTVVVAGAENMDSMMDETDCVCDMLCDIVFSS